MKPKPVQLVPLSKLKGSTWNPRLIRTDRFKNLMVAIAKDPGFLWKRPILAQLDGTIYAGHQRREALIALWRDGCPEGRFDWHERATAAGIEPDTVPADLDDVDEHLARERGIADNNEWGEFVEEQLSELLYTMEQGGADLALLGFDDRALKGLYPGPGKGKGNPDAPAPPKPKVPRSKPGDLWHLGDHRLLVGDCTREADIARLMGDERAVLCVTSPPYWIGREYEHEHGREEIGAHIAAAARAIASAMAESAHIALNTGTTVETKQGGLVRHVWLLLDQWDAAFLEHGWYLRNVRIWAKEGGFSSFSPAQDVVGQDWEFLASFSHAKPRGQNPIGERWALDGVWDCQPQTAKVEHSAPFPAEIPTRYMHLYTDEDDIVIDPYAGSGTTLIAADECQRRCYAMELDPGYADVVVKRWEDFSGGVAVLEAAPAEVAA